MSQNPIRCYLRENIQHVDHGLSNAQCATERTDLSQDMRRVGTLSSVSFEPSTFPASLQKQIQQTLFSISLDQPRPKLGKERVIKTGVSQFQAERIFPSQ